MEASEAKGNAFSTLANHFNCGSPTHHQHHRGQRLSSLG
jgi:hypothetical protein